MKKLTLPSKPRFPDLGPARLVNGYIAYYTKEKATVYEHRLVAEQRLGRPLKKGEVAHHKNGVRHDNRLSNIKVKSDVDHGREHMLEKYPPRKCSQCKKLFQGLLRSTYCSNKCKAIASRHRNRPSNLELRRMAKTMNNCEIARHCNVSETTVRSPDTATSAKRLYENGADYCRE